MTIRDAFTQTQWFRLLAAVLAKSGLHHVIVSPGSRSTPLVCAFEQEPSLRTTLCIDERAAGFMALGYARSTGQPCAVLCTSGTAAAHYFPAVIEAAQSNVPLLVLSADRPAELHANGAAQTTDQTRLFGHHVRAFYELGTPQARTAAFHGLMRKVGQAVAMSLGPHPGPVHINAQAFKPLEPVTSASLEEVELAQELSSRIAEPSHRFYAGLMTPSDSTARALSLRWAEARRPLLFCGPAPCYADVAALTSFAASAGWPVLAEITHPTRQNPETNTFALIDAFDLIARDCPPELAPDLVVSVGATPTSSAWLSWLTHFPTAALDVVAAHSLVDPLNRATTVVQCHDQAVFEAVNRIMPTFVPASRSNEWRQWTEKWVAANLEAKQRVETHLAAASVHALTEALVLADISQHIRPNDLVMLGNSLPIRVAETFFAPRVRYKCVSQRGVSGIDGLIAGAVGTNLGTTQRTWLILGDVSAVHDLSSLRILRELDANVVVTIVDNDGGRIFDSLPVAKQVADTKAWTTPHKTPFGAVARALGLHTTQASTRTELGHALAALPENGPAVIWANVAPHGARDTYRALTKSDSAQVPE